VNPVKLSIAGLLLVIAGMSTVVHAQFGPKPPPPNDPNDKAAMAGSGPVPRMADGKPDLSGMWNGLPDGRDPGGDNTPNADNPGLAVLPAPKGDAGVAETDGRLRSRTTDQNRPQYKPQYWDKVNDLDLHSFTTDNAFACGPPGVPRLGAPIKIVQTPNEIILFYSLLLGSNWFRIIPTTGRDHNPDDLLVGSYNGDSVGRWDGDTLVIDSLGFNDVTWLDRFGYFHSYDLHVVERLTRTAYNRLHYEVTSEDPTVLSKPWKRPLRVLNLNTDPSATVVELPPCVEHDAAGGHIINNLR
jgi:hypothetical protein